MYEIRARCVTRNIGWFKVMLGWLEMDNCSFKIRSIV